MSNPFFSIVIPTKNRPELLRDAISSVLLQDFDDYELIISDNFNDERTKKAVDEFKGNSHLNYIRTEKELSMPDHWEFATTKTKGIYTLILADRAFLRQGSLRDIHNSISTSKKDALVCFWKYGFFDEKNSVLFGENEQVGVENRKSVEAAKDFSRTLDARFLPRPHTGCYRFDIAQEIRKNIGRMYFPFAPDNVSALLLLAFSEEVLYIPRSLVFFQGAMVSNGTQARKNPWPYLHSLNVKNPYQFVPIKSPIISSLVFNDFLMARNLAGRNLENIDIDWIFYFGICYEELMGKKMISVVDKKVLNELFKEWRRALSLFDEKFQKSVKKELRKRFKNILKSYIRETFLGNFLVKIKRAFLGKPARFYSSALKAGGFKN